MSTPQVERDPTNEADEATPLLTNGRSADVEAQKDEPTPGPQSWVQFWTNIQVLTTCSLTFCGLVLLDSLIHYIWTEVLNNSPSLPYRFHDYMYQGTFISTWTAIISVLNFSRLRMNGSQLPWSFNLIVDFIVSISALFASVLFFLTIALNPCDNSYYSPRCASLNHPVVIIGMIEMIFVLGLALTHMMLLIMRIRVPPQQGNSLFGGDGTARGGVFDAAGVGVSVLSSFSSSDGWFCGFGRGPLGVAIQSMPENSRSTQATQAHMASA